MRPAALLALWLVPCVALAADRAPLDPDLPYQARKANPVTYEVDFSAVVTPPYKCKVLRVWLPIPPSNAAQEYEQKELTAFPQKVDPKLGAEKVFGNRFAYFEFTNPEGAQMVRHRFKIRVWELYWDVKPDRIESVERWPDGFAPYLRSDRSVTVDDRLRKVLGEIVPRRQGIVQDLGRVMDWVNAEMKYDHGAASLRASSDHALTRRTGHCSDYHGLCAAFGRALGFPTRVTYGINPFPKNSPSHCKLEAYLPPYGWVSFDVSETQKLIDSIRKDGKLGKDEQERLVERANARLRGGFRDNTWYLQTRGTDYDLAPPAAQQAHVVRTIYAEADGKALPDPDPADASKREFAWMTLHEYKPDRPVSYPFKDYRSLSTRP